MGVPQVKIIGSKEQIDRIRDTLEADYEVLNSSGKLPNREERDTFHEYIVLSPREMVE